MDSDYDIKDAGLRFGFFDMYDRKVASSICRHIGDISKGRSVLTVSADFSGLVPGTYRGEIILFSYDEFGVLTEHDIVLEAYYFDLEGESDVDWNQLKWGSARMKDLVKKSFKLLEDIQ